MKQFAGKKLLVTGGTGSFGNAIVRRFVDSDISEIRIFSRDEKKQDDMRKAYMHDKLKFFLGDVRDPLSIKNAVQGIDYIFHAAALKQVPSCEFFPMQACQTNVMGTANVLDAAIDAGVDRVVCLSTDKAVYPINAMGMSKALMEKVAVSKSRGHHATTINVTRYGNVMGSRGSVIPLFCDQIRNQVPLTITDPTMTRFMMSLDDAVDLVIYAFLNGASGETFVQKSPAATIGTLCDALKLYFDMPDHSTKVIGSRHGEKHYEVLLSREEFAMARDLGGYFSVPPDSRDLNYEKFTETGGLKISESREYSSANTQILDKAEMLALLRKLPQFSQEQRGKMEWDI